MSNHRVVVLLITLIMISSVVILCVHAASPLVVDFYAVPQSGVLPLNVQFFDTSSSADTLNNTYLWTFGDGNTSIMINPPHTYVSSGVYTVNLTVTEATGNNATLSKPYYIHAGDSANATDFSGIPQCGLSPLSVQFIDGTVLPHDQWEWSFGDDSTSNLSDPIHIYNQEGARTVSLHIWNNSGGPQSIISKTDYIRVIPVGVASFSATGTGSANPLAVQFNDASTGFISPVMYHWDFGDAGISADQNPLHTYPNISGSYNVTFTVTDNCGQVITNTGSIIVTEGSVVFQMQSVTGAPGALVADFTGYPTSGAAPLDVTFSDTSLNNPTSWNWTFGDGNSSTNQNPVHTYNNNGNYTVSLTVTNAIGSSTKTWIEYITVPGFLLAPPVVPVANFNGSPTFGSAPLFVQFTDLSSGFNEPVTYLWDFGDNSSSTVRNISHTYTTLGLHSVSLTVTGSDGYSETMVKTGYINTEIPSIEIILIQSPPDSSLPSNEITQPTQSTPQAQSLPIAQSISPGISRYEDKSLSSSISSQKGLSADNVVIKPSVVIDWLLTSSENPKDDAFRMKVLGPDDWIVNVYDPIDANKPTTSAGHMVEYNSTWKQYVALHYIQDPLKLRSQYISSDGTSYYGTDYDVSLSGIGQELQRGEGIPPGLKDPPEYRINLKQSISSLDIPLRNGDIYRVVIAFEATPQTI